MSSISTTEKGRQFADLDDEQTYDDSHSRALERTTRNFVVDFGKDAAEIAFDLQADDVENLLKAERALERPVRWINIWGPNRQTDVVDLIGKHYRFSARLLAIIKTIPPIAEKESRQQKRTSGTSYHKDDLEFAAASVDLPRDEQTPRPRIPQLDASHYTIARQMVHYHSVDTSAKFLCIGANWMHEPSSRKSDTVEESDRRHLWSWLVLCDDHTVMSIHEDPGINVNENDLKSIRANTLSVLSQLSRFGHDSADPISLQTVRQALDLGASQGDPGLEGASNLFYYLFDDWRAVYTTVAAFQSSLKELQVSILGDIGRKSHKQGDIKIIPSLHTLGREIRQMEHVYEGYKNLIIRILEQKPTGAHGLTTPRSFTGLQPHRNGVVFAQSALQRFERLGDRIQLLVLSQTQEFLAEKDALISTYFNISVQKDSEATARLTRAATLLAKLSVLFLPVSLMTAYFSVQIDDLQGVYTSKDYWYSFAVIMTISVLGLFFFAKSLMWITETLDAKVKQVSIYCNGIFKKPNAGSHAQEDSM